MSAMSVSVIVPAYNEAEGIGELVARIRAIGPAFEIIVVDDGSSDATAERAGAAGAKVVVHAYNVGNGAAIKSGVRAASGDIVVFLDGDGQHPPEEIPRLVAEIGAYDMVVGARTSASRTSRFRNVGNWALCRLAEWISGHDIADLTSGFRAIRREPLLRFVHLFPNRYSYPTTITLAMFCSGYFIKYVPIDSITRRTSGTSNIRPFSDFFRFVNIMLRIVMLFSPQRIFGILGAIVMAVGALVSMLQLTLTGGIQATGVILLVSSIFIICFGLLAEQIAALRREWH